MTQTFPAPLPKGRIASLVAGAPVAVFGYGVSNRPLVSLLVQMGAQVHVYDKKPPEQLHEQSRQDAAAGVRFYQDADELPLEQVRVVFRSPGVHPDTPALARARRNGALITSEMAWFLQITPATVLAITGSDGKTTSSTLTAKMLEADGKRVYLGGNIGQPLLSLATEMTPEDFVVLELSSFQLYDLPSEAVPHRAALTNVSPNHLDWHADMADYVQAKTHVFRGERCTLLVTNAQNETTAALARSEGAPAHVTLFDSHEGALAHLDGHDALSLEDGVIVHRSREGVRTPILHKSEIRLPGVHNLENVMTAIGLCYGLVSLDAMRHVARTFGGVPHRLEAVRTLDGVTYYNSSIDSSPSRTAAALSALESPIVAICGGYDKNIPFAPLATALCARAHAVVLMGATRQKIYDAILSCPDYSPERLTVVLSENLEDALSKARGLSRSGDAVLLSPACASFDAFVNFEARGEAFRRLVNDLV